MDSWGKNAEALLTSLAKSCAASDDLVAARLEQLEGRQVQVQELEGHPLDLVELLTHDGDLHEVLPELDDTISY